jgi:alpha-methylacyl-CoA racemase
MGPLAGLTVIEMAGIGPCPFAGMLLADLGAKVVRIDRTGDSGLGLSIPPQYDLMNRGKQSIAIDLKSPAGTALALDLIAAADVVIEGFRPGVMERLGLGPDVCIGQNAALVYGRITGWGQTGPLAPTAGHDINYIALTGALGGIGLADSPVPPLNLLGDFGGGSMFLVVGVLAALLEARRSGKGQIVDAAIVDGAALLGTMFHGLLAAGFWKDARQANELDGGAPWYDCYQTRDGKSVAIGAIEGKFYDQLVERLGFAKDELPDRRRKENHAALRQLFAERIATKTSAEWDDIMRGTDACFAPVLGWREVRDHPHNAARDAYVEIDGIGQPAPAPRFSRSAGERPGSPSRPGDSSRGILSSAGLDGAAIDGLIAAGTVAEAATV